MQGRCDQSRRRRLLEERDAEGPGEGQGRLNAGAEEGREPMSIGSCSEMVLCGVGVGVQYQGWSLTSKKWIRGPRVGIAVESESGIYGSVLLEHGIGGIGGVFLVLRCDRLQDLGQTGCIWRHRFKVR